MLQDFIGKTITKTNASGNIHHSLFSFLNIGYIVGNNMASSMTKKACVHGKGS